MDFRIHHSISELTKALGVQEKNEGAYLDNSVYLKENQTPYITLRLSSQSAVKKLAEGAPNPAAVMQKYEDLNARNFRELDAVVQLLSEIKSNDQVKSVLKDHCLENQKLERKSSGISEVDHKAGNTSKKELHESHNHEEDDEKDMTQEELSLIKTAMHGQIGGKVLENKLKMKTRSCGVVEFPDWLKARPRMTWDFTCDSQVDNPRVGPLGALPPNVQENLLIKDILFCLSGIDGDYITAQTLKDPQSPRQFRIDESADPSLLGITKRITPVFSYYSTIISFIEEKVHFKYGLVNHSVCDAMRVILKDYFIMIAQLEHQHLSNKLSLQKIMFYIQPVMIKLQSVADTVDALNKGNCFGGSVLSVLHKRANNLIGDKVSQEICFYLVQCAAVPYFEILEKWIFKGIISDPYLEFLVEDNEVAKKEDAPVEYCNQSYWEKRYTVRKENIPVFLETAVDMILRTGKYLNVIRQCGRNITCPDAAPLTYVIGEQPYFQRIHAAYQFASKKLLDLLMEDNDLEGRLRSVKHYFLLDEGDFIVQFMDMAEEELYKDIDDIMPTRLESLLELALRTSAVNSDKYKDDVKVTLLMESLQSQIHTILNKACTDHPEQTVDDSTPDMPIIGMEAFAFEYEVKWPLSLIINQRAIACYQLLFRHLFHCKHVEALLGRVWTLNKVAKTYPLNVSASYSSAFALCQRMLHFIQTLEYYFMLEIIEPLWHEFRKEIPRVSNVDEVLQLHEDFLNTCIKECMLSYPEPLQMLGVITKLCISFYNFMQGGGDAKSMSLQMSFKQQIKQFTVDFDGVFKNFCQIISKISTNDKNGKMTNMLNRLDFNGFYEKEKTKEKKIVSKD